MPQGIFKEDLGQIDWELSEIHSFDKAWNWCIRFVVGIVSSYSDSTVKGYNFVKLLA